MKVKKEIKMSNTYTHKEVEKACLKYFDGDELAASVWMSKYAVKDKQGEFTESSPVDMHIRMANEFSRIEDTYRLRKKAVGLSAYGETREHLTNEKIFDYFDKFKYIVPQGSVMSALGNPYVNASFSNCIVLPELHDSYGGICYADEQLTHLMKRRCGVGMDLSPIRPKKALVSNSAGNSTGAVSFMNRFSNTTREVAQDGRRGALMLSMSVNHPDIYDFVNSKQDLTQITGANISIKITDEFMLAVQKGKKYTLKFPVEADVKDSKTITKEVDAKHLWGVITKAAHKTAEPK